MVRSIIVWVAQFMCSIEYASYRDDVCLAQALELRDLHINANIIIFSSCKIINKYFLPMCVHTLHIRPHPAAQSTTALCLVFIFEQ